MKIACITMVRNECDIIELFLKINLRRIDHIFVIDHKSTDDTAIIINKLIEDGFPITYLYNDLEDFRQADIITAYIRKVSELNIFDYLIPLDADEFLSSEMTSFDIRGLLSGCITKSGWALIPWRTYCPISDGYYHSKTPLFENFRMRAIEPKLFYKIVVGNEYAKNINIAEGNHFSFNESLPCNPVVAPLSIQHVPIRSSHQIINKAITGSYTLQMKANRQIGEGFHWDEMAQLIRANNYNITNESLLSMAINYATPLELRSAEINLDHSAPRIGDSSDCIVYLDSAHINLVRSFDLFIGQSIDRFKGA